MSFKKVKVWHIVAIGLTLVMGLALVVNERDESSTKGNTSNGEQQQVDSGSTNGKTKQSVEKVTYVRTVDGDTIVVRLKGLEKKVRLVGVDAPESVSTDSSKNCEEGKMASANTEKLLANTKTLWISKDQSEVDSYGRLLRFVWLEKPSEQPNVDEITSKMLNAILLQDGYAQAVDYEPDTTLSVMFHQLGDEATAKGLGLTYMWKRD